MYAEPAPAERQFAAFPLSSRSSRPRVLLLHLRVFCPPPGLCPALVTARSQTCHTYGGAGSEQISEPSPRISVITAQEAVYENALDDRYCDVAVRRTARTKRHRRMARHATAPAGQGAARGNQSHLG